MTLERSDARTSIDFACAQFTFDWQWCALKHENLPDGAFHEPSCYGTGTAQLSDTQEAEWHRSKYEQMNIKSC